jgi:isopentenyl-diphosphate delta-isomerase
MTEHVVTVDAEGCDLGTMEKLAAHRTGTAHRAVSVMVRRIDGQVLLQQRSTAKYHCPGLWSNTCCGHPLPNETPRVTAERRIQAELGIACSVEPAGLFRYQCAVTDGLIENELVHLFVGTYDGAVNPNPEEVHAVEWLDVDLMRARQREAGRTLTPWFQLYLQHLPHFVAGHVSPMTSDPGLPRVVAAPSGPAWDTSIVG